MDGYEIELKMLLDDASLRKLRRLPWLREKRLARPVTRHLSSTYFDTADGELRRRGISLRVRSIGRLRVQGVKAAAVPGTLARREWERAVGGAAPDLDHIPDDLVALFDGIAADRLTPLFRTDVRRTTYRLGGGDWQAEMAIDVGEIVSESDGGARTPIREAELELVEGRPGALYALALELADRLPMRVAVASKSDRGYALIGGPATQAQRWRAPVLGGHGSAADAFQAIAGSCLEHLLANAETLRVTGDPEAIHQMRVALRRLRSAVTIFGPFLAPEATASLLAEAKWLVCELGPARDTDVFLAEILAPVAAQMPDDPGMALLLGDFAAVRETHYAGARLALDSQRCTKLLLAMGAWIEGGWRCAESDRLAGMTAAAFAADVLEKRDRKVRKLGHRLADLTAADRHRLRIMIKKLRYAGEFFASLWPEGKTRRYLAGLAGLQDRLGALNDIAVATDMLPSPGGTDPLRAWSAGAVIGWHAWRRQDLLRSSRKAWKGFADLPRFWR